MLNVKRARTVGFAAAAALLVAGQIDAAMPAWDLMVLNDFALNWPAAAELIAMPAPGLFT